MNTRDQRNWIIAAVFGVVFWVMAAVVATAQHVPSLQTTDSTVTIDADIVWHSPDLAGVEVLQGTVLMHDSIVASSDGASPIVLRMPIGSHQIDALGFPADRKNPQRTHAVLTVDVVAPGRQQQINEALAAMFAARDAFLALQPTAQEVADAFTSFIPTQSP